MLYFDPVAQEAADLKRLAASSLLPAQDAVAATETGIAGTKPPLAAEEASVAGVPKQSDPRLVKAAQAMQRSTMVAPIGGSVEETVAQLEGKLKGKVF